MPKNGGSKWVASAPSTKKTGYPPQVGALVKTTPLSFPFFGFARSKTQPREREISEPCEAASLASGSMRRDPARNPKAPNSVNRTEIWAASNGEALLGTKAKKAEIMKATQPRRFVNVIHQDKLSGFNCQ